MRAGFDWTAPTVETNWLEFLELTAAPGETVNAFRQTLPEGAVPVRSIHSIPSVLT
jgi:hypothetical protein